MKDRDVAHRPERQDRFIRERVHDTYKLRSKLPEPTRCPECGAVFQNGRWIWTETLPTGANEELCQACLRIKDHVPAGEVLLEGRFVASHRDELLGLARNIEREEKAEHPLNRIIAVEDRDDGIVITTTDIHLPHAIGHAVKDAWGGGLKVHYDEGGYFARIEWRRED